MRLGDRSRMSREVHVRFWESARVRFPRATHLPLARQERLFARHGARLSRKTLCDWVLAACELLGALRGPLHQHILGAPVIFGDDTTLRLIAEGLARDRCVTARLWGYVSAGAVCDEDGNWQPYPKAVLYEFTRDRRGEHPQRILEHYRGYLQADDYAGYHALFKSGRVLHAACWAHARRPFFDLDRASPPARVRRGWPGRRWIGSVRCTRSSAKSANAPPTSVRPNGANARDPCSRRSGAGCTRSCPICCPGGRWPRRCATSCRTGGR